MKIKAKKYPIRTLFFLYGIELLMFFLSCLATIFLEFKSSLLFTQWGLFILTILITTPIALLFIYKNRKYNQSNQMLSLTLEAIYKSSAIVEFNPNGTIITANQNFLNLVGYSLQELIGKHHSILVDNEYKNTAEYRAFWDKLNQGHYELAEYKRIKKNGEILWLLSSYNPILDADGNPIKIIKVAQDVTTRKQQEELLTKISESKREIAKRIGIDSQSVTVGIDELKSTVIAQASSASEQAASISEISTTIEQIKTTAKQTLEKAKLLGESAKQTSKQSEKGREAVETMNESTQLLQERMNQISTTILGLNDKTQQIREINETVSSIAQQSKMLALNASIEAAKAGESGKGFAVVASEVKDLAEKSQLSTELVQKILQDIRQTAEHAVMVTEDGTKSVAINNQQVQMTGEIISSLGKVIESNAMDALQIVSAIREAAVAIEQIDISMKEVDKVTNMFTSITEQTKSAITHLSGVCESLNKTAQKMTE